MFITNRFGDGPSWTMRLIRSEWDLSHSTTKSYWQAGNMRGSRKAAPFFDFLTVPQAGAQKDKGLSFLGLEFVF